jgi:hypothetical protein
MFSPAAKARLEALKLTKGRANLEEFADTLQALATADRSIVAVTSDSRGSGKLGPFGKALPKQIVEVGIAEQNLVGITAGLAACGKKAFGVSPSCFLTARSLEQIKNDLCYSNVPGVLVGISAGVSYGALGSTHHSLHDLAVLRAIHNIIILVPADNFETREAIRFAATATRPVFVRFGKAAMHHLHPPGTSFVMGRAITLREGSDVAFIANGETVVHAVLAAAQLADRGHPCPRAQPAHGQAARYRRHSGRRSGVPRGRHGRGAHGGGWSGGGGGVHPAHRWPGPAVRAGRLSRRRHRHRRPGGSVSSLRHLHGRAGRHRPEPAVCPAGWVKPVRRTGLSPADVFAFSPFAHAALSCA